MIALLLRARDAKHVAVFTIHEPPNPPADRIDRAETMVFIPDGFSWMAALFAPLWLVSRQLWLALAAYLTTIFAVAAGFSALGLSPASITIALAAINVWLGFEAFEIQRLTLSAKGWGDAGSVSGRNLSECERRFFDLWLAGQPVLKRAGDDAAPAPEAEVKVHEASAITSPRPSLIRSALNRLPGRNPIGRLFSART